MVDPDKPNKCKLGITQDPTQRIKAYRTAAPQSFFFKVYESFDKRHEKRILSLLKEIVTVDREYVHCSPSFAQNIIEGYFDDNNIPY